MLSMFLRPIRKTLQTTSPATLPANDSKRRTATEAEASFGVPGEHVSISPDTGKTLCEYLEIIIGNAEFMQIRYGESIPLRNITAIAEKAIAEIRSIKTESDHTQKQMYR